MELLPQITTGLPLEDIKKVEVKENNESLVDIVPSDRIELLTDHKFLIPKLRKSVAELLTKAAHNLPEGHKLLIVTAYRPFSMQQKLWRQRLMQIAKRHPLKMLFNYSEWKKSVTRYTAPPGGSSHQCGAAVDLMVLDSKGERLDMGTSLTAFGPLCNTFNDLITPEQKANRKILYDAMTNTGFVNYPLEWWHYSYGDRMWAAYTRRGECVYSALSEK